MIKKINGNAKGNEFNEEPHPSTEKSGGKNSDIRPLSKYSRRWMNDSSFPSAAGKKGGSAKVPTPHYSRCIDCEFKSSCPDRFWEAHKNRERGKKLLRNAPDSKHAAILFNFPDESSRCRYELESKRGKKLDLMRDYKAFVSMTPEDTLEKLHLLFKKLEGSVSNDPSYTKLASLFYMMMNIYKMKFGKDAPQVAIQLNNNGNPSMDIKSIMNEMRNDGGEYIDKSKDEEGVIDIDTAIENLDN